ncbi:MSCRAMM family protein [Bifidobacterium vansinderenii]|uniref:Cna protein B-type domain-containing protein n=1 Tax=Bifidobacterium vansinderenii TaxID=1984871 RepID=A0A229VWE2_9BIFI|nr:prealbumin-like fold domain-containing protein [Bifidobacterium vansinderenii]OXM99943.1 Cna protein B-type domain-containing protein [Bifidobacterium vansinderenii]
MKGFRILVKCVTLLTASLGSMIGKLVAALLLFLAALVVPPGAYDDSRSISIRNGDSDGGSVQAQVDPAKTRATDTGGKRVHISSSRFIVAKIEPDAVDFNDVVAASKTHAINPDGTVGVRDGGVQFVLWPEYRAADGTWYVYEQRFTERNSDGTWKDEGRWYQSTLSADGFEGDAWIETDPPNLDDGGSWSPMPQGCDGKLSNGARYCTASQMDKIGYAYWGNNGSKSKVHFPVEVDDYTQPYEAHPFKYRVALSRPAPSDEIDVNVFFGRDVTEITAEVSHRKDSYWRVNSSYVVQLTDITGKDQIGAQSDTPDTPNLNSSQGEDSSSLAEPKLLDAVPQQDNGQSAVATGGIVSPQVSNIDSITLNPSKLMVGRAQKPGEFKLLLTALPNDRDGVQTTAEMTPMPNRGFRINDDRMTMGEDWYGSNDQSLSFTIKPNDGNDGTRSDAADNAPSSDSRSSHGASRLDARLTIATTTYDVSPGYGSSSSRWFSYQLCEQGPNGGCATQQDNAPGSTKSGSANTVTYDLSRYVIWVRGEIDERNAMRLSTDSFIVRTHDRHGNDLTNGGTTEGERGRFDAETLTFTPRFVNSIRGHLSFTKQNEQGTSLPGAEFTADDLPVTQSGDKPGAYRYAGKNTPDASHIMTSGADGRVHVTDIDLTEIFGYDDDPNSDRYGKLRGDSVSYTITETKAPPGYVLPAGEPPRFKVTLHSDGTIVYRAISERTGALCENGNDDDCRFIVVNSGFRFLKVDDNGNPLRDAIFRIFEGRQLPDNDNDDGTIPAKPLAFVPVDGNVGSYNFTPAADVDNADGTVTDLATDGNGSIRVHNLPDGTYTIREIRAPIDADGREIYANKQDVWFLVTVHEGAIRLADEDDDIGTSEGAGAGESDTHGTAMIGPDVAVGCTNAETGMIAADDTPTTPICVATATNHRVNQVAELPLTGGSGGLIPCMIAGITLLAMAVGAHLLAAALRKEQSR